MCKARRTLANVQHAFVIRDKLAHKKFPSLRCFCHSWQINQISNMFVTSDKKFLCAVRKSKLYFNKIRYAGLKAFDKNVKYVTGCMAYAIFFQKYFHAILLLFLSSFCHMIYRCSKELYQTCSLEYSYLHLTMECWKELWDQILWANVYSPFPGSSRKSFRWKIMDLF